ncbi:hypothetical protein SLEP1_g5357 [Rubroshorea leprosula]|uniref:Uncharacterized protein n=1 Tax=Rubroshorea leprosula TaxID=152421 RepID=A0AAV5HXL5_9ROSI|nr:hypothetical protein SLEP1_g5357 [Rubroshorea leprosula]
MMARQANSFFLEVWLRTNSGGSSGPVLEGNSSSSSSSSSAWVIIQAWSELIEYRRMVVSWGYMMVLL